MAGPTKIKVRTLKKQENQQKNRFKNALEKNIEKNLPKIDFGLHLGLPKSPKIHKKSQKIEKKHFQKKA